MALTFFSGFETGDFGEWDVVDDTPAIDDGTLLTPHTGDYHMRCNASADSPSVQKNFGAITFLSGSFNLYIATSLGATESILRVVLVTDSSYKTESIQLDQNNKLTVHSTLGATALNSEQWYRISFVADFTDETNWIWDVWIDGNLEHDGVSDTPGNYVTPCFVAVGVVSNGTGDIYIDNVVIDGATDADLGDIRVLRASPNAAGEYAEFDTVSGYENCDEVPADGATTIVDDSGVSVIHRETYNLQDATTIGVGASDTIKAVNIWVQAYDSGNTAQGITVRDDGTDYETMLEFGKAYTWKNKLYDTNAPRASAWTPAIFTAFQSGGYNEGSKDMYMSTVMVMVAYTPVGVTDYPISLSPGLTVLATVAYAVAWDRGMSPGLTASATIARALAYNRATTPGLTVSTTIAKSLGRLLTSTANLTVSSTVARFMTYTKATTANLTAAVTVAKSFGKKIVTTATLVVSTTIAMSKGFVRAVTSNLTASATVSKAVAYNRATTPGLTVSATIARIIAYHRAATPGLSIAVSIVKSFGRTIATTTGLTISATIVKSWGRTIATSAGLTVSATINRAVTYKRAVSSGLTTAVTIAKSFGKMITTASNLSISVTVSRVVAYKRATQPALSVAVSVARSFGRTITTTANLVVSVVVIAVKESGIRLARAWGIIFG